MQTIPWGKDPRIVQQDFYKSHSSNDRLSSLFLWATWAVEGLYYLADLEDRLFDFKHPNPVEPYRLEVVDTNHARGAAGTAITAGCSSHTEASFQEP
jgi:hypothetical protein